MTEFKSSDAVQAEYLDPIAQKVSDAAARLPQLEDGTVDEARALRRERGNPFAPKPCELDSSSDHQVAVHDGRISLRVYKPITGKKGLLPALVFYHGGGFVLGDVEQYDTVTQHIAGRSECIVVSVDYRLAPDNKIKGIHADGFTAYRWVYDNASDLGIDRRRIAIGGDSAGGNLSIAVALLCKRHESLMPAFQVLIYPSVDLPMRFPSVDEFAEGYFLTRAGMKWFRSHYLETPEQAHEPELVFLERELDGLPPALVITAGFDPLRDEGKAFADRLTEFAVPVRHLCYTDMIHGFLTFAGGIEAGMDLISEIAAELNKQFL
ncbi:MAG: alpha/beta hydrolase [Proteobacteria bacterium]|nr:alpha/beta hydrolase [Pseudomonadota bacterium]